MTQSLLLGEQPRLYPDFYRCQQCAENLRDDQRARRGVEPDGLAQEDGPAPVVEKFPQLNAIKSATFGRIGDLLCAAYNDGPPKEHIHAAHFSNERNI